jgi:hypothetical protein
LGETIWIEFRKEIFMKGYKGFAPGLVCLKKQYAENTVFEEEKAEVCSCGMHFCRNPFDVLDYYDLVRSDGSFNDFAEVEALADTKTDDNKKFCTTRLKVGAKLSCAGFVKACVDFVYEKTIKDMPDSDVNTGNYAQIGSSGDSAQIGSSGDSAKIGSSGYSAQIGSSGDSAKIGSSGDSAKIGSSGNYAKIDSTGEDSVICCAGHNSIVKAKKGSWITLAEWKLDRSKNRYVPACVKTEFVDGKKIKEDVFYKLVNGEFVEIK